MNPHANLERALSQWFEGEAGTGTPEGLLESTLTRLDGIPQQPAWLPTIDPRTPRLAQSNPIAVLAILVLLMGIVIGVVVVLGEPAPPDVRGGQIAFVRSTTPDGTSGAIFVMNADGSGMRQLTDAAFDVWDASWSPDGTMIAFSAQHDGLRDLFVMNVASSAVTRLTHDEVEQFTPAWAPDGSQIAVARGGKNEGVFIYTLNADGSGLRQLTDGAGGHYEHSPSWSPDGSQIAFISDRGGGTLDIYVINADGSGRRQLTSDPGAFPDPGWDMSPAWSPDGSKIAFGSDRSGDDVDIYVMNADGSDTQRLTLGSGDDWSPAWSADGTQIMFFTNPAQGGGIYVMNADGSGVRKLADNLPFVSDLDWLP